jgi:hypothetical protein
VPQIVSNRMTSGGSNMTRLHLRAILPTYLGLKHISLNWLVVAGLLTAATLTLGYPLIWKGYLLGDDGAIHVLWAQQYLKSIHSGIFFPQWVADANLGCGNATFIFYPPFIFYIYALINLFTNNVLVILNMAAILGIWLSGLTMYAFCRNHMGKACSLLSAIVYMALPYHLVDLYNRSALAEFWSFVWLPLIFLCLEQVRKKPIIGISGLAVSYAALIVTHLPTALLVSPVLIAYSLFLHIKGDGVRVLLRRILSLPLGLGLSAFYLFPVVFERRFVDIASITNYKWFWLSNNFLFSRTAGDIGFNHYLSVIAVWTTLLCVAGLFVKNYDDMHPKGVSSCGLFFCASALFLFVMMLSPSSGLWKVLPYLNQVQFPWRVMTLTTFFAATSVGLFSEQVLAKPLCKINWPQGILVLMILGVAVANFQFSYRLVRQFEGFSFERVKRLEQMDWSIRPDSSARDMLINYNYYGPGNLWMLDVPEYRPAWSIRKVTKAASPSDKDMQKIWADRISYVERRNREVPKADLSNEEGIYYERDGLYTIIPPLRLISPFESPLVIQNEMLRANAGFATGPGILQIWKWDPETRRIHVETMQRSRVLVKTFYYPRWRAYIDGKESNIQSDPDTGLISIETPAGTHEIELRFGTSIYRFLGIIVSVISFLVICFIRVGRRRPLQDNPSHM